MIRFKFLRTILLATLIVAAAQTSASADKDLQIVNHTGRDINRLYLSPAHIDGIGYGDLLGTKILSDNATVNVHCKGDYRYYDMRIVFTDDEHLEWSKLDLDGVQRLVIYKDGNVYKVKLAVNS